MKNFVESTCKLCFTLLQFQYMGGLKDYWVLDLDVSEGDKYTPYIDRTYALNFLFSILKGILLSNQVRLQHVIMFKINRKT